MHEPVQERLLLFTIISLHVPEFISAVSFVVSQPLRCVNCLLGLEVHLALSANLQSKPILL